MDVEFPIDFGYVYTDVSAAIASLRRTISKFEWKQSCPFHIDIRSVVHKWLGSDMTFGPSS